MPLIFPKLNEKLFPGISFDYSKQSAIGTTPFDSDNKNQNLLSILLHIKHNETDSNLETSTHKTTITHPNHQFYKSQFFVNLSEFLNFVGLNGVESVLMINSAKPNPLTKIDFVEDCYSLFIKKRNTLVKWSLNKNVGTFEHIAKSAKSFKKLYGDSYVSEITFGRESIFQLDVAKKTLEEIGIEQGQFKDVLDYMLGGKQDLANIDTTNFKWLTQQVGEVLKRKECCNVKSIKVDPSVQNVAWDFSLLSTYISSHAELSKTKPTLAEARIKFYKDFKLGAFTVKSHKSLFKSFESEIAPNCIDLFQSLKFIEHISVYPESYPDFNINRISRGLSLIKSHLLRAKKLINDPKFSPENLKFTESLAIPSASEFLGEFFKTAHDPNTESSDLNELNDYFSVQKSEGHAPEISMRTLGEKETIHFKIIWTLCNDMVGLTKDLLGSLNNITLPKYYLHLSRVKYFEGQITDCELPGYGPGIELWKIPTTLSQWAHVFNDFKKDHDHCYPSYISIIELEDKLYTVKNIYPPVNELSDCCRSSPRAISIFADGNRVYFHAMSYPSIAEHKNLFTEELVENFSVYQKLKAIEHLLQKRQTQKAALDDKIDTSFVAMPHDRLFWIPSLASDEKMMASFSEAIEKKKAGEENIAYEKPLLALKKALEERVPLEEDIYEDRFRVYIERLQDCQLEATKKPAQQLELELKGYRNEVACEPEFKVAMLVEAIQVFDGKEDDRDEL